MKLLLRTLVVLCVSAAVGAGCYFAVGALPVSSFGGGDRGSFAAGEMPSRPDRSGELDADASASDDSADLDAATESTGTALIAGVQGADGSAPSGPGFSGERDGKGASPAGLIGVARDAGVIAAVTLVIAGVGMASRRLRRTSARVQQQAEAKA